MSGLALSSRTRVCLVLAATFFCGLVSTTGATPSAQAATKPCWERLIDDWVLDGRIDGVYSERCRDAARRHLPEDLRAYSNFDDELDATRQTAGRTTQGRGGGGSDSGSPRSNLSQEEAAKETKDAGKTADGPIPEALNAGGPKTADSIPLPLIILAALALVLMTAGAAGFAHRKLRTRKPGSG